MKDVYYCYFFEGIYFNDESHIVTFIRNYTTGLEMGIGNLAITKIGYESIDWQGEDIIIYCLVSYNDNPSTREMLIFKKLTRWG